MSLPPCIAAGNRLSGQVLTFADQFHRDREHEGHILDCGNGTCRSSLKDVSAWASVTGRPDPVQGMREAR